MSDGTIEAIRNAGADADKALDAFAQSLSAADAAAVSLGDPGITAPADGGETPPATETPEVKPQPVDSTTGVDQRFKTLQGKYNAEVPRMARRIAELEARLAAEADAPRPTEPTPAGRNSADIEAEILSAIPKETLDKMDPEAVKLHASMIAAAVKKTSQTVDRRAQEEVAQLRKQMASIQGQTFWDRVEREIPGASDIDQNDPLWAEFLEKADETSGLTYRDIGARAIAQGDVHRVAGLMRRYLTEAAGGVDPIKPTVLQKPSQSPVSVSSSAGGSNAVARGSIRMSDITTFYSEVARGRYSGREAERASKEAEIERAVSEGRVVAS